MEGIGLIEKKSKNSIQWLGAGPGCNTREVTDKLLALKEELVELEDKEMELDQHFSWAKQSIINIMDDSENKSYLFVEHQDITSAFSNDNVLLLVKAPMNTTLDVPHPEPASSVFTRSPRQGGPVKPKFLSHIKSRNGPIDVYLVNNQVEPNISVFETSSSASQQSGTSAATLSQQSNLRRSKRQGKSVHRKPLPPQQDNEQSDTPSSSTPTPTVTDTTNNNYITSMSTTSTTLTSKKSNAPPTSPTLSPTLTAPKSQDINNSDAMRYFIELNPPPSARDYRCNLDTSEGVNELFDIDKTN